ncbi:nuclear transport factor 2 family protein [Rhodococcoides fascians A25f]|uniref:nuclear transport factor 2 family protein n=1 Tax=Rhodococcoides fascians TaxID=1828 RepID=UPI00068B66A8|nr:nuclear transport factor 2 family protein [Rhodococcus fascians]QII04893.1 nuclear transport factor 2 family protein [Rhodococcus fascians A25f]
MTEEVDVLNNWAVAEVLARYAHVVDNQEWEELASVFTPDATLEAEKNLIIGLDGIRGYLESFDPKRSHHTLNTITDIDGDIARVWSRFIVVEFDATSLTGDYVDQVIATGDGARISRRRITVRNRPDIAQHEAESFASWARS